MNYMSNDELERYWFQYKAEPHGTPLETFCEIHRISYKALDNWRLYKMTPAPIWIPMR